MNDISVLSTYALDILVKESGEIISRQAGGPLLFIEQALKQSEVPYKLFYGDTLEVEILIKDHREFGKVPIKPDNKLLPNNISDWVLISTLLQEWDLQKLKEIKGKVFIDIQGYVRQGDDFGEKRTWEESQSFADQIYCMKGTREEISYLPSQVREGQKKRVLLITDGPKGVEIFHEGKHDYLSPKEKINAKNTLGAGDTFFAYVVALMYKGNDILKSVELAQQETVKFLKSKA